MKILKCFILFCLALFPLQGTVVDVLTKLQERSQATHSDAVLIVRHGNPIFKYQKELNFVQIDCQEMTKSFIALAFALLIDEGKIPCLDVPVKTFYPKWNKKEYSHITLKHLLNKTSGLDCGPCLKSVDSILKTKPVNLPGITYYNSPNAVALLVDLIKKISGKSVEDYLYEKLFLPLGAYSISWQASERGCEYPKLKISALDLARVGCLIMDKGMWGCKRIISEQVMRLLFKPSQEFDPFFGMQWWLEYYDIACWWEESLLEDYAEAGMSDDILKRLYALEGRVIHFGGQICGTQLMSLDNGDLPEVFGSKERFERFLEEVRNKGLSLGSFKTGKLKSVRALGKGGQQLIIIPNHGLVAVRQKRSGSDDICSEDQFDDLSDLLHVLAKECDCYID